MTEPRSRRLARRLLGARLEAGEVDPVLDDLEELRAVWDERHGRWTARARWWIEVVRYVVQAPPRAGARPGGGGMDGWIRDGRWALRRMARRPGPAVVVVLTLGLGVGAATTVYSVLDTLVVQPLPFDDADRLVRMREEVTYPGQPPRRSVASPHNATVLRARVGAFADVAAARYRSVSLAGDGAPERVTGVAVTWNHFRVLGAEPLVGRTFRPEEDAAGGPAAVVVLSHALWTRRFGRDPAVVGAGVVLNGRSHTVVGVMPPGFRYPYAAELWYPLGFDPASPEYLERTLNVTARLAPGVSLEVAREESRAAAAALRAESPDTNRGVDFVLIPLREEILEGVDRQATALLWGALFVLLIGAANVASMVLARLQTEQREVAVVLALGASRRDVLRRVFAESALLAALAGGLGLAVASLGAGPMAALSPVDDLGPYFAGVGVNGRVVAVAVGLAMLAALLTGLPAALRLGARGSGTPLRPGCGVGQGRRSGRALDLLVAGEIAVAVILLTGAGLMGRSLQNLWGADVGMDTAGLLTVGMSPSTAGFPEPTERVAFVSRALEAVRAVPGVVGAGVTNMNPFRDQGWGVGLWPEGRAADDPGARFLTNHRAVTPGFLEAAGTRVLAGRGILPSDGPDDPPVALLSAGLARRLFDDEEVVGRRVRQGAASGSGAWITVVGVVEEVADYGELDGAWYRPLAQAPEEFNTAVLEIFVATGGGDASAVFDGVRAALRELEPDLPLFGLEPVDRILRFERRTETFTGALLGIFAGLGLTLAVVGVHGVLSYALGRRRRELGLRKALGAGPAALVLDLVRRTLVTGVAGLAAGLVGAALLTRFLEAFLVGVSPLAPGVFAVMGLGTLAVACAAAVLPALRVLRLDPRAALAED